MSSGPPSLFHYFRHIATPSSPQPVSQSRLFNRHSQAVIPGDNGSLAQQVQQLASEVDQQSTVVTELASVVSGKGSALQNAGSNLFGGSVLGGIASSASSGFSWQSIVKDIVPFGGLLSGIAGLFSSPATPAPLEQYDAPVALNFDAAVGPDGRISQASYDASGQARASSPGLDVLDAAGGPQSAYSRAADGSLKAAAGDAASRHSGVLDLSSTVQNLVAATAPPPAPAVSPTASSSVYGDGGGRASGTGAGAYGGTPASGAELPSGAGLASGGSAGASAPAPALPAFDGPWFMDHAPYIAAAVRNAMLEYHPVVDVVNDL